VSVKLIMHSLVITLTNYKMEERSMYKYVFTYKVAPAFFSVNVYVWEENECACGTRWLYASDERYV